MKVRVISPHLDDACWSAAGIILNNDAIVITICAGVPPKDTPPTMFDERAGFATAQEAMKARRKEDDVACNLLGAKAYHLDYLDVSYRDGEELEKGVRAALADVDPDETVLGPLGLKHPDHQAIATAFRRVAREKKLEAWIYEDLPYAYAWPEYRAPALLLAHCGEATLTRESPPEKRDAVLAYQSQVHAGTHIEAILAPEMFHRLSGNGEL